MYTYREGIKKVREEDELFRDLHRHCDVLDNGIIRYLEALINLELNVVREGISQNDREILSQLSLFRDISTYNIYHMSKKIIKDMLEHHSLIYKMRDNNDSVAGLKAYLRTGNRDFQIFDFDYSRRINEMTLFKLETESADDKELLMNIGKKNLSYYYNEKNPYPDPNGKDYLAWEENRRQILYNTEEYMCKNKKYNLQDIRDIEISKKIYEHLLDEFGLEDKEFNEIESMSNFEKIYIKQMPGLHIKKNIKNV